MDARFVILNERQVVQQFAKWGATAVPAVAQALHEEAQRIFERSQDLVPFDEGTLAQSGQVFPPAVIGDGVMVEIGYGGAASAYAEVQHENLAYRHDPGRQAKYLEEPFYDRLNDIENAVAETVEKILKGY